MQLTLFRTARHGGRQASQPAALEATSVAVTRPAADAGGQRWKVLPMVGAGRTAPVSVSAVCFVSRFYDLVCVRKSIQFLNSIRGKTTDRPGPGPAGNQCPVWSEGRPVPIHTLSSQRPPRTNLCPLTAKHKTTRLN